VGSLEKLQSCDISCTRQEILPTEPEDVWEARTSPAYEGENSVGIQWKFTNTRRGGKREWPGIYRGEGQAALPAKCSGQYGGKKISTLELWHIIFVIGWATTSYNFRLPPPNYWNIINVNIRFPNFMHMKTSVKQTVNIFYNKAASQIGTNARARLFNAGLLASSQFASGRSCDRPTRSRFSVAFLGPRANAELVPRQKIKSSDWK
jgi:hypothetical protein